jgi:hypothetical protein
VKNRRKLFCSKPVICFSYGYGFLDLPSALSCLRLVALSCACPLGLVLGLGLWFGLDDRASALSCLLIHLGLPRIEESCLSSSLLLQLSLSCGFFAFSVFVFVVETLSCLVSSWHVFVFVVLCSLA